MSRNIKIELELPEFEKELNISVTLRKDGEVIETSLSSGDSKCITEIQSEPVWKQREIIPDKKPPVSSNLMDMSF